MGLKNAKTLIRDTLVDDATIQGLFGAAGANATASCRVNMEYLRASANYPQILIGWGGGATVPGMDADEGQMYLTIECKGTGTTHALEEIGLFRSEVLSGLDDKTLSATNVCYWIRKFSEIEGFDDSKKVWWLRMGFNTIWEHDTSKP